MPPSLKPNSSQSKSARVSILRDGDSPPPAKKFKPLTFVKPPLFTVDSLPSDYAAVNKDITKVAKRKGKAKQNSLDNDTELPSLQDDGLWVDMYEPKVEDELAVHNKKVQDVRRWLDEAFDGRPSGKLKKYRRILALTGPAGTAKTATIRVLARARGIEIIEWNNSIGERFSDYMDNDIDSPMEKFQAFLLRASACRSIFGSGLGSSRDSQAQQIILLEDLPNILHPETQVKFHEALRLFVQRSTSTYTDAAPIVIVISDAGVRGQSGDDSNIGQYAWKSKEVVDVRSVLPPDLLHSPYITQIRFNPIAPTLMKKGLQILLDKRFQNHPSTRPSKDIVDAVVESSQGDIRSAVMTLQFACVIDIQVDKKGKRKSSTNRGSKAVLESISRREQSLALFHLIGKVLYNKRKGDPPGSSATKKDIECDRVLDNSIKDPNKLPSHLKQHERKASRVHVDTLYADAPIDSSLFSLYLHQNYTQFCNEVEECAGISDWLSWVDCSGPEEWFQANPHRFHLLTLGTLHYLPTPVIRRSQKFYKPDFFEHLKNEKNGVNGVKDVRDWLLKDPALIGGWSKDNIATELGAVLKTAERSPKFFPPESHRYFSTLTFDYSITHLSQLDEEENEGELDFRENSELFGLQRDQDEAEEGGWLDDDEIEEF